MRLITPDVDDLNHGRTQTGGKGNISHAHAHHDVSGKEFRLMGTVKQDNGTTGSQTNGPVVPSPFVPTS